MTSFTTDKEFLAGHGGEFGRAGASMKMASRIMARSRRDSDGFTEKMRGRLSASGGMMSADALSIVLQRHMDQPISTIARWIVSRQIVNFEDCSQWWIPMFQFDAKTMCVIAGVRRSMSELAGVFDDREMAEWFATPNIWLTGRVPASIVAEEGDSVTEAARAHRLAISS